MPDPNTFTTKKRILLVNLSKIWGGGEKWFLTMGQALVREGFPVTWMVYPDSPLEAKCKDLKLPYTALSIRVLHLPFRMSTINQKLRSIGPDLVLLNASHELKTIGILARELGIPHIVFRRGVSYPLKSNQVNQWIISHVVTAFLANSQATFDAFKGAFPIITNKPHLTINNGIHLEEWKVAPKPKAVPSRIGMVARLSTEKGIDRAIYAMQEILQNGIQAELHIMGEGPEEGKLKQLTKELGISDHIRFRGFIQEVQKELSACSLFVFTPQYGEGTSIALIEAMALAIPCIVMDTPAMNEVVVDGKTGYVVPDGDIQALSEKIAYLLTHDENREEMGQAAQARAHMHFNLNRIVKRLADWIESL